MHMKLDSVLTGMLNVPPVLLPVFALLSVWMWNAALDRSPAGVCVDSGIIFIDALAQYGIEARLEPVQISICDAHAEIVAQYGSDPRWNADATFNGHTVITLPGIGRFADATVQQFSEIPASDRARLPLIAPMPSGAGLGTEPFIVQRTDHAVIYQGFPGDHQHLWRHAVIDAHRDGYHFAAANLAANVFDILRSEHLAPNVRQAPYPRLHQLLDELSGAQSLVEEGKYVFRHPIAERPIQLADIPFADGRQLPSTG
jgi:hypothetical protein